MHGCITCPIERGINRDWCLSGITFKTCVSAMQMQKIEHLCAPLNVNRLLRLYHWFHLDYFQILKEWTMPNMHRDVWLFFNQMNCNTVVQARTLNQMRSVATSSCHCSQFNQFQELCIWVQCVVCVCGVLTDPKTRNFSKAHLN